MSADGWLVSAKVGMVPKHHVDTRWASHHTPINSTWKNVVPLLLWVTDYAEVTTKLAHMSLSMAVRDFSLLLALAALRPLTHAIKQLPLVLQKDNIYIQVCMKAVC